MKKGLVIKSKENLAEDIALINTYTRSDLTEDEVYTFSVVLCDNEVDRDYERFTVESLFELEKLFVGKTGIMDHSPKAENQLARIYKTEVQAVDGEVTTTGDQYFRLIAKAYVPKTESTKDFISKLETGILKEVSVGCSVESTLCSICGNPINSSMCNHHKGEYYGDTLCYGELTGVKDAYEWSFVAVPSQKKAGVIKSFLKGENFMENIIKCLKSEKQVTLNKDEKVKLLSYIQSLEKDAECGMAYRESVVKDIMRLSLISKSGISSTTMESIVKTLSINELCELRNVYQDRASERLPIVPQSYKENKSVSNKNQEFTI